MSQYESDFCHIHRVIIKASKLHRHVTPMHLNRLVCMALPHQLNCGLQELVKAIFHIEKPVFITLLLRLVFTCTADEHGAAEANTATATCVDPDGQRFDQSPLLKCHVIRQPGSLKKKKKITGRRREEQQMQCKCYARESAAGGCFVISAARACTGNTLTCNKSLHCACRICTGCHRPGVWRRRRWWETSYSIPF